jgi:hypothetical protein
MMYGFLLAKNSSRSDPKAQPVSEVLISGMMYGFLPVRNSSRSDP